MALSRGTSLVLLGVVLLVAMLVFGAVTAPDRTVAGATTTPTSAPTPTDGPPTGEASSTGTADGTTDTPTPAETGTAPPAGPRTLVGVQGGWVTGGNVRTYAGTEETWRETSADGYFEVSHLADGTVLAAFANETATECGDLDTSSCARTGFRHIDPAGPGEPDIVAEYSFPVESLTNSEVHAVDRTGEDEYVFVDMDTERVVVVEDGEEVWEWRASERYEAPPDPTSRDWLHMNDVDAIDEDRFLVSVRNANQILVVERGEGVVEVINEDRGTDDSTCLQSGRLYDADDDGDVACGDPDVMKEQHNPQWVGPGVVLVADSGNDRVVELHENDGSWAVEWVVREANGELDWPRDADRLPNGNTLITDSLNQRVVEVGPDGEPVWTVSTAEGDPQIPYEADRLPYGEFAGRYEAISTDGKTGTGTGTGTGTAADGPTTDATTPVGTTAPGGTATAAATPAYTLPTAGGSGAAADETGSDVPGLTLAVVAMRGTIGWLPLWFAELHLAVTAVSLLLVVGGGVDHWRNPDREVGLSARE